MAPTAKREITIEELESLQHEAFVLGQATGLLLKYGHKELATQLYNTASKIMAIQREAKDGSE